MRSTPKDLFISYSRRDNEQGRVTELVERIRRDFEIVAGRPLRVFFDHEDIEAMNDWQNRILDGLRESRLLLVLVSPNYLKDEYCEWEFTEYLNLEAARSFIGEGIAPVYCIEVPGWDDKKFDSQSAPWV